VIAISAIVVGIAVDFSPLDPIKALIWSAVLNGVIVVPIMVAMMIMASRRKIMGEFTASRWQVVLRLGRDRRHGRSRDRHVRADVAKHENLVIQTKLRSVRERPVAAC